MNDMTHAEFTAAAKDAEFYETDRWAAENILDVELLTRRVLDPCAGRGVLGDALMKKGYRSTDVAELDLNHWPGQPRRVVTPIDFLKSEYHEKLLPVPPHWEDGPEGSRFEFSVIMNPPFSRAADFVRQSFKIGARKILMFQRFAFLESSRRRAFFRETPPARVWICGDRAVCWRGDVPEEDMLDPDTGELIKGKKGRSTPTPHAWFVWERGHQGTMTVHQLWKDRVENMRKRS